MAITKRAYIDLEGLSAFKTSLLGTVINDSNKTTTNKTATIKAIADYVDSEIGDLSSAITADLAKKVSSVTYDTTNKKFVYNKGGSNTDIVTVATLKSDIGTFVKSGSTASAGLVPAPSTTAGTSKYLREDGTWATPPDTNTTYETATKDTLGLVKSQTTGTTSNRNYGVEVNSDGTMKVNVPWTDTKVTSTASTTTKAYLVGSTSASTNTDTLIKDTNVYLDATAGKLVATTFEGALSGNATTATRATQDSAGQQIDTFYIKGLSVNGKDITYTKGDGKTGTITTQDTTYSTATSSTLGLVKSSTTGKTVDRDYNVEVNSDGTMKVNVPWTNTTSVSATTTGNGNAVTSITASGSAISVTKGATFLTSHQDISGKEDKSNKVTSWSATTTDDHYPSERLVKSALDGKSGTTHTHGSITKDGKIGTASDKLVITTTGGALTTKTTTVGGDKQPIYLKEGTPTAIGITLGTIASKSTEDYLASSLRGTNNGVASLDASGLVPSSQLPSYVDDVLEYETKSSFPSTGEGGKIYVDISTNLTYRWSGSAYVEISKSLALGETSSTAYAGDKGKTLATNLSNHTGNTTVHITASERTSWNGKENASNKVTSWSATTTHTNYPSEKLVKDSLDGKYAKPSDGIPKSDLASAVQTSLGKADTALQKHQDISGKENTSNKVKSWSSTTTDDHYPSEKLVKDSLDSVYSAINNFDYRGRVNTWSAVNTFSNGSDVTSASSTASGAIIASNGGIWAAGGIRGNRVYNAVWNDLADCIPVDNDCELTPGYCYCFDGEKYYKSSKYLDDGIIGIHSDTYGMHMGYKDNCKQMDVAVAGFVLAYVDKEYPAGTPLTCTENGYLTKIEKSDKIEYPEKIVATYWKNESSEYWGGEKDKIKVNGRKWVKIK